VKKVVPRKRIEDYDDRQYSNQLYKVVHFKKRNDFHSFIDMQVIPPIESFKEIDEQDYFDCPIIFKLELIGPWAK